MHRNLSAIVSCLAALVFMCASAIGQQSGQNSKWSINATIIEACSCPMFCQCYFDTKPAAHGGHGAGEHFCRFNNAYRINRGSYGNTKLDGARFWVAGDLGGDFSMGKMDWAVLHFDPSVTPAQREGITQILGHVYPVKWNSFSVGADAPIDWKYDKDTAVAKLGAAKLAEVSLKRFPGNTDDPIVIKNLKYWGTPRNDGFVLMPNVSHALREVPEGRKPYEFKGTNGFMITFDMKSDDVKKAGATSQ